MLLVKFVKLNIKIKNILPRRMSDINTSTSKLYLTDHTTYPFCLPYWFGRLCLNIKLRFHLCVMRMMNANATKNRKYQISIGVLLFVRMRSMTTMKWIPSWAIRANANGLLDRKSLHTQGSRRVAHTSHRGKLHWSLNVIRICRHIRITYKWNLSFTLVI